MLVFVLYECSKCLGDWLIWHVGQIPALCDGQCPVSEIARSRPEWGDLRRLNPTVS